MSFTIMNLRPAGARGAVAAFLIASLAACSTPEERANRFLASGQELLAKGDLQKASLEFRNAVQNKKDLLPAWRALAQIEERRQNWAGMIPILRTIIEYDGADHEARLKLGRLLVMGGVHQEALPLIASLSDGENPPAAAVGLKATILLALKDLEGAVKEAQRARAIQPDNLDAASILAMERLTRHDIEGALDTLAQGKVGPDEEIPVAILRVQIFDKAKDYPRLETELRKLIALQPQAFRRELTKFYLTLGRELDAERELRATAAAEPGNPEVFLEVVRFLMARKGPDAAQRELEERIRGRGDVFAFELALAELHASRNHAPAAVQVLERLISTASGPERKTQAQLKLAALHLKERRPSLAGPLVEDILKNDNRNIEALRLRAVARIELGQLDSAVADLREALKEQPQSAPLLLLLAGALERSGSIELAERHFADATRASQFNPSVGLSYAAFLRRRGSAAQSEHVLIELADRNPNNVEVWSALGEAKLQTADWVGAQSVAETIKRIGDRNGLADRIRGQALTGQNKLNDSLEALHSAFQAAPSSTQPMTALVRTYLRAQKPDEAETFLKGVLSANPANADALVLMGSVQLLKNAPEQALASFETAVERQPQNAVGHSALADFYMRQNKPDLALQAVDSGLKEQPESFQLRLVRASILEVKRDVDAAINEYETMLARQPESLVVANNLASLLSDHRTDQASLERAQTLGAMLRKSNVPAFKDTLGWLSYHKGDYRSATGLLEEAAQALPNLAQVRYHLGMTYLKSGQAEKGQEQLKKAAELDKQGMLKDKIEAALRGS
jgi:tetratricopeptide (TPR) repeat protein